MSRETTNKILDMMDEGTIDPTDLVMMCLKHMSESEVADMARMNELLTHREN